MDNLENLPTNKSFVVELLSKESALAAFGEAEQTINANPTVVWAKFILTDDGVNGNGQRVPMSEFKNLVNTGINMPVKMAYGEISPGHQNIKPIGVMTHLKEVLTTAGKKAIVALAALWSEERPADVQYLREKFASGEDLNVSWEILYGNAVFNEQLNCIDLQSTVLKAAAIVGNPAYGGRTHFLSVSAVKWSQPYIDGLPDEHFLLVNSGTDRKYPIADAEGLLDLAKIEEATASLEKEQTLDPSVKAEKLELLKNLRELLNAGESLQAVSQLFVPQKQDNVEENTLDKLEELKAQLAKVEADLAALTEAHNSLQTANSEKESALAELQAKLGGLQSEIEAKDSELNELRTFKSELEAEAAKNEKIAQIKSKFSEAGLVRDEQYFADNGEKFLGMAEEMLGFFIEELKAQATKDATQTSVASNTTIPALIDDDSATYSVKELAKALKARKSGK